MLGEAPIWAMAGDIFHCQFPLLLTNALGTTFLFRYEEGKLLKKPNTFLDFASVAEYLCKEGYTTPSKLSIYGRSAGGLLIGAVINMRPDLFKAALTEVPFVDVINTMFDSSIPWTAFE
jgi:oligopeptidase B